MKSRYSLTIGAWCTALLVLAPVSVLRAQAPLQPGAEANAATVTLARVAGGDAREQDPFARDDSTVELRPEGLIMPGTLPAAQGEGSGPNLISLVVDDVSLQDVVRMFTRISGANIIATSTNLQGRVTVNLQDVEWKPALISILDMHNLTITEKTPGSGIYSILPKAPGAPEPLVAQTLFLNYASVSNLVSLLQPLVGPGGTVAAYPNANALVVRATAQNLSEIRRVVEEVDRPRKQVYIEAKFLELSDEAIKDLGINWQVLEGYRIGVGGLKWDIQENRDKIKSRDAQLLQSDKRTAGQYVNESYDADGNLYQEQTTVYEPTYPGSDTYIQRVIKTPTRSRTEASEQRLEVSRQLRDAFTWTSADIRTAVLSANDFSLVLSALKQMRGVNIISNPKIIVANEETAEIHIGENEPNIKGTVTAGQQGQANTTTYALDETKPYFKFGITLEVTPTINNDSNITVRIVPTLSRFVRDKVAPDNNTFPVEATKTIKTVFRLESGKTAAIGGLTETSEREETSKIPLLGDIPLLGKYLFSHTHRRKAQSETIIFVTVGLANPEEMTRDAGLPGDAELVHRHTVVKPPKTAPGPAAPQRPGKTEPAVPPADLPMAAP